MISKAGIAVFVFGNKLVNSQIVDSNGMEEEFEICLKNNVIPIPVGATGYVSKKLWTKVTNDLDAFYPQNEEFLNAIKELGNDSSSKDDIIKNILKAISILQKA
jgi:hypothetical protein